MDLEALLPSKTFDLHRERGVWVTKTDHSVTWCNRKQRTNRKYSTHFLTSLQKIQTFLNRIDGANIETCEKLVRLQTLVNRQVKRYNEARKPLSRTFFAWFYYRLFVKSTLLQTQTSIKKKIDELTTNSLENPPQSVEDLRSLNLLILPPDVEMQICKSLDPDSIASLVTSCRMLGEADNDAIWIHFLKKHLHPEVYLTLTPEQLNNAKETYKQLTERKQIAQTHNTTAYAKEMKMAFLSNDYRKLLYLYQRGASPKPLLEHLFNRVEVLFKSHISRDTKRLALQLFLKHASLLPLNELFNRDKKCVALLLQAFSEHNHQQFYPSFKLLMKNILRSDSDEKTQLIYREYYFSEIAKQCRRFDVQKLFQIALKHNDEQLLDFSLALYKENTKLRPETASAVSQWIVSQLTQDILCGGIQLQIASGWLSKRCSFLSTTNSAISIQVDKASATDQLISSVCHLIPTIKGWLPQFTWVSPISTYLNKEQLNRIHKKVAKKSNADRPNFPIFIKQFLKERQPEEYHQASLLLKSFVLSGKQDLARICLNYLQNKKLAALIPKDLDLSILIPLSESKQTISLRNGHIIHRSVIENRLPTLLSLPERAFQELDDDCLNVLIGYLYHPGIKLPQACIPSLYQFGKTWNLKPLCNSCVRQLSPENCDISFYLQASRKHQEYLYRKLYRHPIHPHLQPKHPIQLDCSDPKYSDELLQLHTQHYTEMTTSLIHPPDSLDTLIEQFPNIKSVILDCKKIKPESLSFLSEITTLHLIRPTTEHLNHLHSLKLTELIIENGDHTLQIPSEISSVEKLSIIYTSPPQRPIDASSLFKYLPNLSHLHLNNLLLNETTMQAYQRTLPGLTALHLDHVLLSPDELDILLSKRRWKLLSFHHLQNSTSTERSIWSDKDFIKRLFHFNHLRKLTIDDPRTVFTWETSLGILKAFDTKALPHLTSFTLSPEMFAPELRSSIAHKMQKSLPHVTTKMESSS